MAASKNKQLMRNIGEFFGHILKGVRTDPGKPPAHKHIVTKKVEEIEKDNMILRRTTIDEVEFKNPPDADQASAHDSES